MGRSQEVQVFIDAGACRGCGSCATACPLIETRGTPDEIITECPADVLLCANCGVCSSMCPSGLFPAEALFYAKHDLIQSGNIPDRVRQVLRRACRFADVGHHFPFVYYSSHDTVFWPGCGLAGLYPAIVRRTIDVLSYRLNTEVGVALDCCYDPVHQFGDVDTVSAATRRIQERLRKRNISRVITGCINCQKILSKFLKDITVEHILEILPRDAFTTAPEKHIYLHHPCPIFHSGSLIRQRARELLGRVDKTIAESQEPMCCGYGGGLSSLYSNTGRRIHRADH